MTYGETQSEERTGEHTRQFDRNPPGTSLNNPRPPACGWWQPSCTPWGRGNIGCVVTGALADSPALFTWRKLFGFRATHDTRHPCMRSAWPLKRANCFHNLGLLQDACHLIYVFVPWVTDYFVFKHNLGRAWAILHRQIENTGSDVAQLLVTPVRPFISSFTRVYTAILFQLRRAAWRDDCLLRYSKHREM